MEIETAQRTAIRKALEAGLPERVQRLGFGSYRVPSTTHEGVEYAVRHGPGLAGEAAMLCTCPSGYRPVCLHRAAVWIVKQRARGIRVTGLAAPLRVTTRRHPRKEVALV